MSNNLFVGLAVGTVMGMCIAAKTAASRRKSTRPKKPSKPRYARSVRKSATA